MQDFTTLVEGPFHRGRGISLLTFVSTSTTSLMLGCCCFKLLLERPVDVGRSKQRAAMVAMWFKAGMHKGGGRRIRGSQMAKVFPCLISGKAQSMRLDKLQSGFCDIAFFPVMISNKSTPKLNTSVSSVLKTVAADPLLLLPPLH